MVLEDEAGFFAVLLKGRQIPKYMYVLGGERGGKEVLDLCLPPRITAREEAKFQAGVCYRIYENGRPPDGN